MNHKDDFFTYACVFEKSCLMFCPLITQSQLIWTAFPDRKVPGANMGPIWGRQDPGGPHVGPMNLAIWVTCVCWMRVSHEFNLLNKSHSGTAQPHYSCPWNACATKHKSAEHGHMQLVLAGIKSYQRELPSSHFSKAGLLAEIWLKESTG